jgi:hypothetical protein
LAYCGGLKGYKISSENQQWHQIFIFRNIAFVFNGLVHVERAAPSAFPHRGQAILWWIFSRMVS